MIKWRTQAGNLTINMKVKLYFTLPEFSANKFVMWEFRLYPSTKIRYTMILDRDVNLLVY